MQHRIITSVAVLMGALILAIIAGVVPVLPFSTEETAYAQTRPNDATLSSLGLTDDTTPVIFGTIGMEVTFAPDTAEYTARVENLVNVVTVTPVTNNPNATYRINSGNLNTPTQVTLRASQNTRITITVLAADGRTRQTYTVTVYRVRSAPLDNANLSALRLAGVNLSPRFSSGTMEYDARVRYDVTMVTVAATAADIGAMVPVVGLDEDLTTDTTNPPSVDVATNVVTLGGVGHITAITVTVTPETGDATDNEVYTIRVYRESGPVLSRDATLSELSLVNSASAAVALVPSTFAPGITEYTARVDNSLVNDSVTVTATLPAGNRGAKVDIRPTDEIPPVDDEDTNHDVYLNPGANTVITAIVTAEDGRTRQTYTITVYQERVNESDNANLSALSLSGVSLSPVFDPETIAYKARVSYDVEMVTVAATAADIGADTPEVGIDGTALEDGANNVVNLTARGTVTAITVTVTPETDLDADNKVYTIMVYRESGPVLSNDITIGTGGLTLQTGSGTTAVLADDFTFNSDITEYAVSVASEVVTVAVALDHAGATFEITPADLNILDENHQVILDCWREHRHHRHSDG